MKKKRENKHQLTIYIDHEVRNKLDSLQNSSRLAGDRKTFSTIVSDAIVHAYERKSDNN